MLTIANNTERATTKKKSTEKTTVKTARSRNEYNVHNISEIIRNTKQTTRFGKGINCPPNRHTTSSRGRYRNSYGLKKKKIKRKHAELGQKAMSRHERRISKRRKKEEKLSP